LRVFGCVAYVHLKGKRRKLKKPKKSKKITPRVIKRYLVRYKGLREYIFKI